MPQEDKSYKTIGDIISSTNKEDKESFLKVVKIFADINDYNKWRDTTVNLYYKILENSGNYGKEFQEKILMSIGGKFGWQKVSPKWLGRLHANGQGISWMHKCLNATLYAVAQNTDTGNVKCKNCGKSVPKQARILMELQKLKIKSK